MSLTSRCPVCDSRSVTGFLNRRELPVHQHLLMPDQESAINVTRGDLELAFCGECGFIYNRAFEPHKLDYGGGYDNTQTWSPVFDKYLDNLAQYLTFEKGVRNCRIVEVGSGDGTFLRKLVEAEGSGNSGYGFDPSYNGPLTDLDGRIQFIQDYYSLESAREAPADIVVCRHVIEHIPDHEDLLRTVRQALVTSPDTRVFFETPSVEWILRNKVIWDFFYEHCYYFGAASLSTAFENSGFAVESVKHVFGGQYLWLEATLSNEKLAPTKNPGSIPHLAKEFSVSEEDLKRDWEIWIQNLASKEKVALWGAGAKGVTLANLIDSNRTWITCVVDLNPHKQGHYVPGTGHPIVSHHELADYGVTAVVLMNPNYQDECQSLLREANLETRLVKKV